MSRLRVLDLDEIEALGKNLTLEYENKSMNSRGELSGFSEGFNEGVKLFAKLLLDKVKPVSSEALHQICFDGNQGAWFDVPSCEYDRESVYEKRILYTTPQVPVSEPVGELRCDASTGHTYGVYWYKHAPAIGTKVYTTPQPAIPEGYALAPEIKKRIAELEEKLKVASEALEFYVDLNKSMYDKGDIAKTALDKIKG